MGGAVKDGISAFCLWSWPKQFRNNRTKVCYAWMEGLTLDKMMLGLADHWSMDLESAGPLSPQLVNVETS